MVACLRQRAEQRRRVVLAQCAVHRRIEFADLARQAAQFRGVVAGPSGHGTITRSPIAFGLHPLFAGGPGEFRRAQSKVAALGGLTTGYSQRGSQVGPTRAVVTGRRYQSRLPLRQFGSQFVQQRERRQGLSGGEVVGGGDGVAEDLVVTDRQLSSFRRHRTCHRLDDTLQ